MAFDPDGRDGASWYGGLVGPPHAASRWHVCGFDDGEVRAVGEEELRVGVEIGVIASIDADDGGLRANVSRGV
eukprot:3922783-Pleurochrysis_carterae.AAC.1